MKISYFLVNAKTLFRVKGVNEHVENVFCQGRIQKVFQGGEIRF